MNILVENVDVALLKRQKGQLLSMQHDANQDNFDTLQGVINLLEHMIDKAEGFR